MDSSARIGVSLELPQLRSLQYGFLESIPAGLALTGETVGGYVRDLGMLFKPSTGAYKSVGSFIAIGQIFPSSWDWYQFLYILAVLSIMLGVMNLLPIPALDGGHIVFTIYEMITGRKPSDNFLMGAQVIGLIILFGEYCASLEGLSDLLADDDAADCGRDHHIDVLVSPWLGHFFAEFACDFRILQKQCGLEILVAVQSAAQEEVSSE